MCKNRRAQVLNQTLVYTATADNIMKNTTYVLNSETILTHLCVYKCISVYIHVGTVYTCRYSIQWNPSIVATIGE